MKEFIRNYRDSLLVFITLSVITILFLHPPIPQYENYNFFANQCSCMGLPHAENTITNLPFLFVGLWGLMRFRRYVITCNIERFCWLGYLIGVTCTFFGSSYYHLDPDNFRLVWDRIPVVFAFISLFHAILAERVSKKFAKISLLPLLALSISTVIYWYFTETWGLGDMRAYILVQLLPMLLIPFILKWYSSRYSHGWMLLLVGAWYLLAKIFEGLDAFVYDLNGYVSGHGIKHLLAALACVQVVWMLERRSLLKVKQI
ncbi:MAG: alkaline phytoceramidase [Gammaproteobacteria bacterium]|jgi:hypothetical protein|nr:alkaline phytoceramidase [Gammaproteobacteria bacterium]